MLIKDLLAELGMDSGTAPRYVIRPKLIKGLKEFFRRSDAWVHSIPNFQLERGKAHYSITPPEKTITGRVIEWGRYDAVGRVGKPLPGFTQMHHPNEVLMDPVPRQDELINVRISLVPMSSLDEFPDDIYEIWEEGIKASALYEIFSMPAQEWSNGELAKQQKYLRDSEINRSQQVLSVGHSNGIFEVRVPRFG